MNDPISFMLGSREEFLEEFGLQTESDDTVARAPPEEEPTTRRSAAVHSRLQSGSNDEDEPPLKKYAPEPPSSISAPPSASSSSSSSSLSSPQAPPSPMVTGGADEAPFSFASRSCCSAGSCGHLAGRPTVRDLEANGWMRDGNLLFHVAEGHATAGTPTPAPFGWEYMDGETEIMQCIGDGAQPEVDWDEEAEFAEDQENYLLETVVDDAVYTEMAVDAARKKGARAQAAQERAAEKQRDAAQRYRELTNNGAIRDVQNHCCGCMTNCSLRCQMTAVQFQLLRISGRLSTRR